MKATPENLVKTAIQNALKTLKGVFLFANPSGTAWLGAAKRAGSTIQIAFPRRIAYGVLAPGAPDLIGFRKLVITPDMVGSTVAQFIAVEVKRAEGGRVTKEQADALDFINNNGGMAVVVTSLEQFMELFE